MLTPYWFNNIKLNQPNLGLTEEQYNEGLLGTRNIAKILDLTPSTVARYCRKKIIKASRSFSISSNGSWQITPKDLHIMIKKYTYLEEQYREEVD